MVSLPNNNGRTSESEDEGDSGLIIPSDPNPLVLLGGPLQGSFYRGSPNPPVLALVVPDAAGDDGVHRYSIRRVQFFGELHTFYVHQDLPDEAIFPTLSEILWAALHKTA